MSSGVKHSQLVGFEAAPSQLNHTEDRSMNRRFAIAVTLLASSVGAQAAIDVDPGQLPGSFLSLVGSGAGQNVFGGSVYDPPNSVFSGSTITAAIPKDLLPTPEYTVGKWLAAGPSHGDPATLQLGSGVTAVSFFWGSPDDYNTFAVQTTSGLHSLNVNTVAADAGVTLNQDQDSAYYVTFRATGGDYISSIKFGSSGLGAPGTNAIEISNVTVVPEPEAYGLALAGMGVVAFAMRRRRTA
jgi:hypothetical protein